MSLKLWLPLNDGTLTNQGLTEITMTEVNSKWSRCNFMGSAVFHNIEATNFHRITSPTNEFNFGEGDDFTITLWLAYVGTAFSGQAMSYAFSIGQCDSVSGGYGIGAYNTGSGTAWRFGSEVYTITHPLNAWKHVAFVKKGDNIKIYLSGTLAVDTTFNGTYPTYTDNSGIGIGCFHYSGGDIYPNNGYVADFRIYDNALSAKEIKDISNLTLLHYPLEGSEVTNGSIVSDCSGWGRNAVLSGTATDRRWGEYTTNAKTGMPRGLYFNESGYIHNDNFNMIVPTFTLSFWGWIKTGSSSMQHFLLGTFNDWPNNGIGIFRDNTNSYYRVIIRGENVGNYLSIQLPFTPQTNEFYTIVYDGSTVSTYVNGVVANTASYNAGNIINPVFYLFNSKFNNTPASENDNAWLGDVRFMLAPLNATEVRNMYKSSVAIAKSNTVCTYGEFRDKVDGNLIPDYLNVAKISCVGWYGGEKIVTNDGNLRLGTANGWEAYYWYNNIYTGKSLVMEFDYRNVEYGDKVLGLYLVNMAEYSYSDFFGSSTIVRPTLNDGQWHHAKCYFTGLGPFVGIHIRTADNNGFHTRTEFRNFSIQETDNYQRFLKNGIVTAKHLDENDGNVQITKTSHINAAEFKEL